MQNNSYQIKLPHFEGPFDLLLHFIERDELNIYEISISKLIDDFLIYIHQIEKLNIELASEFILFVSSLMRIKAKMLIPRKEIDNLGNEIDPREELINKVIEYKKYKDISIKMAELESIRIMVSKRGNIQEDFYKIGNNFMEGTEIQTLTIFKLMKTFEKVIKKFNEKITKPTHIVNAYSYTIENSRNYILDTISKLKLVSFEVIFKDIENKVHAIFLFLSMLELIQQNFMTIMVGTNKNNFIIEYIEPENRLIDIIK